MKKFITALFILITLPLSMEAAKLQISPIDSLTSLLKTYTDTPRVIVLNKLSFQYLLKGQHKVAIDYGNQARQLSEKLMYKRGQAKSLINIGNVYLSKVDLKSAEEYYLNAYTLATEIRDVTVISHCTNNLGEVYRNQGNYEKAIYYYLESLRVAETLGDRTEQAGVLNNIGIVYSDMNNVPKSVEFYTKALAISTSVNNKYAMSTVMLNLGRLYHIAGNTDSSYWYYQHALLIKEEIQDLEGISSILLGLGNLTKDDKEALAYYSRALNIKELLHDLAGMSACLNNIGNIYFRLGNSSRAIESQKAALQYASEADSRVDMKNAYYNLAKSFEKIGQFKTSLEYFQLYSATQDSVFASESASRIAEMQVKYETEKKEKEVELLKKEQAFLLLTNRNQKIIFGSAVALVAMAGAVFYFRTQTTKQKNRALQEKIESQNRELTTISLLVTKKNQAFGQIKNELNTLSKSASAEGLQDIVKSIDHEIDFDEEWNMFKYHFEKVHPDFFSKLKTLAPSLSVTELRLCAYLRSNFTTKEIASITNTTVRSVQQAKYRINQKFPGNSGNVVDYLARI